MMKAIIGREPDGIAAFLDNHQLYIQTWNELPLQVRKELEESWNSEDNFETYFMSPLQGATTHGTLWTITPEERIYVNRWEMNDGFWYKRIVAENVQDLEGNTYTASTEIILPPFSSRSVLDVAYPAYLNNKEKMLRIATWLREGRIGKK